MTLDATKPSNTDPVSGHAEAIRENRSEINGLSGLPFDQTSLVIAIGTIGLIVGTDLSDSSIEVVNLSADGAVTIGTITLGTAGQIKVFIAEDDDVTITNEAVAVVGGVVRLNQVPAVGTYNLQTGDILALCNVGGGDGYWKELWRTLFVG